MAAKLIRTSIFVLALVVLASCSRPESPKPIDLPSTPLLSVRAHWGVAKIAYVRVFAQAEAHGVVQFLLRAGDIVDISAKTGYTDEVRGQRDYWYHVIFENRDGWVFGDGLDLYDSRERAENASRLLTNG